MQSKCRHSWFGLIEEANNHPSIKGIFNALKFCANYLNQSPGPQSFELVTNMVLNDVEYVYKYSNLFSENGHLIFLKSPGLLLKGMVIG